jgi:hypothetical protein
MNLDLSAHAEWRREASTLLLRYQVHNPLALPVLLFDRRWDHDLDAVDRDWMEVFLDGGRAVLIRGHLPPPDGVVATEYPIPYGRRLEPGATHITELCLPLPLLEDSLWMSLQRPPMGPDEPREVEVERVDLHLGWCVLRGTEGLPEESREPVELGGERMHRLDGALIAAAQQTAATVIAIGPLPLRRFAGGVA